MKKLLAALFALSFFIASLPSAFAEELIYDDTSEASETAEPIEEEFHLIPNISYEWINLYVDNALVPSVNRVMYIGSDLYVPAQDTALLLSLDVSSVPFSDTLTALLIEHDGVSAYLFDDSYYAIINYTPLNLSLPCYNIDGVLYAPLSVLSETFGVESNLDTSFIDKDLYLTSFRSNAAADYENKINSLNLKSDTDYLIWVSKANYSVRLFKKTSNGWVFEKEFPCAIGAPSTPTCEGTYKFYERITAWNYTDYYVGPVMRFNKGYALHSTILNYDGTPKNNTVEAKISHGCVRLRPDDINYLYETIPLYTTVYVTAE